MLVFFIIVGLILILNIMTYFSKIKLEIDTLKIDNTKKIKINDFKIKIFLVLGKNIKWLKIEIDKAKLEKAKKTNLNKLILKIPNLKIFQDLKSSNYIKKRSVISKAIKKSKINLERLDLKAEIGLDNVIFLSFLVAILDTIISINLAKRGTGLLSAYKYEITPIKREKFYLKLSINCIISIKVANIINMIIKMKRGKKNERTSNRIFNGNCYE